MITQEPNFIFEPYENKILCGGFNVVGGGVIDKTLFFYNKDWYVNCAFYADPNTFVRVEGSEGMKFYSEDVLCAPILNQQIFYDMLKYNTTDEEQLAYFHVKAKGKATNAIDFLNVYASILQLKCVGIGLFDDVQDTIGEEVRRLIATSSFILFKGDRAINLDVGDVHVVSETLSINDLKKLDGGLYLTPDKTIFIEVVK